MEEWQLLQRYSKESSEEAFEELIRRHVGLVYSTALRRLNGDESMAKDVAQIVFTNLARKAHTFGPNVVIAGWLHRDTCFTALEVLRRESRRQAREQVAATMSANEQEPEGKWDQIRPELDEALQQLHRKDRDAILLRFFEQRSLTEIGQRLGLGESGASRRVTRALEKLRVLLQRRGIATTAAGLTAVLGSHAIQAVPAGLAGSICAASVSSAAASTATSTLLTVMASLKAKIGIAVVVGAAIVTPLVVMKVHSRQKATESLQQLERERVMEAAQHMLALITFAANNSNRLPSSLEDVGLDGEKFELVRTGALPTNSTEAATTLVIREKNAWQTPLGTWARAFGYADGHTQLGTSPDGNFSVWENPRVLRRTGTGAAPNP